MGSKRWIVGATLSALLACSLAGIAFRAQAFDNANRVVAEVCAATGIRPLDVARILLILMLAHYLLAAPALLKKAKRTLARSRSAWQRLKWAGHFGAHLGMQIVVPAFFCVIVEGGHHVITTGSSAMLA